MNIKIEKEKIRISFPYDKKLVATCNLLGMRFSKARKDWFFDNNLMNRECTNKLFPGSFPQENDCGPREPVVPNFLMDHQKKGLITCAKRNRFGIYHDTGTGKTLTTLEIVKHHDVKTLVICPLSLIEGAWMQETRDRYPDMDTSNLWTAKKRSPVAFNKALEKKLCVINYEAFRTIDKKLAGAGFDMVVLDESARIKSPKSSTAKKVVEFCDNVRYAYLLSGVPAPNSLEEYFNQIRILDPMLWGKSFYKWRTKYFYPSGYGGYTWDVKPDCEEKLKSDIATVAEYVNKADVLDLPERTDSKRVFQLSDDERRHYKNIKRDLVTILDEGETITSANAMGAIMKLRQLSSGFLMDDGEIYEVGNSKTRELMQLLEDIGRKQVIIWIQFKHEAAKVKAALAKVGYDSGILNSTTTETEKQEYLRDFKLGALQYIICHPKSVGYGHTLVNCSDAIYYSSGYSYDDDYQSRDRIYRYGQKKKCSYYYLIADKTMDKPIMEAVQKKEKTSMAVLNYLKGGK
jgi:SNF2 family DNA or RNA helicase